MGLRARIMVIWLAIVLIFTAGCSSDLIAPATTAPPPASRSYHGTASVGDFMNISLNSVTQTITYKNLSNGDTGIIPYTANANGTYTLHDPTGNLIAAYEIPGYAMLIAAEKAGADHATPALITAVAENQITLSTFAGHSYNYMQFRTAAGGFEAGSAILDAQGNVSISSYWPYGATMQGSTPFNTNTFSGANFSEDASGTFLTMTENGSSDYVFGTTQGIFIVDTPNGAIMSLKQAATKNFDPSVAGTYQAIFYQKTNAATGGGNVETGTPSLANATLVIDAQAHVTVADAQGNIFIQTTLTPVADTSYLYGSPGQLASPCNGLFSFRVSTPNALQDVFVTFMGRAVLFASFKTQLPVQQSNTYDYLYGVGLK
jgi:hypothetical protein